jgi:hypothetical protein
MIVDAAELADFPADGHTLEHIVLENQVARVTAFGKEEIFFERFGTDGVVENVVLNSFQGEVAVGYGGEIFDPIGDIELFDGELFGHNTSQGKYSARQEDKEVQEVKEAEEKWPRE